MSIYDEMQKVARDVLGDPEFKQGVIKLVQSTPGTGPADDPGAPSEKSYTLNATARGAPYKFIREGFVTATDMMVVAAVVDGVTPTKNDFIEIDGVRCKIIEDVSAPGAGTKVVWKFLVRK